MAEPLSFNSEPSQLSTDEGTRHEELVDLFGQFIIWIRNWSLRRVSQLLESEEARESLGTVRKKPYDSVARLTPEAKDAAIALAESTVDDLLEKLIWSFGNEGTDSRFGKAHAYRFEIKMEIVDVVTGEIVRTESINRGGKFFGSYWGRWLNRYRAR